MTWLTFTVVGRWSPVRGESQVCRNRRSNQVSSSSSTGHEGMTPSEGDPPASRRTDGPACPRSLAGSLSELVELREHRMSVRPGDGSPCPATSEDPQSGWGDDASLLRHQLADHEEEAVAGVGPHVGGAVRNSSSIHAGSERGATAVDARCAARPRGISGVCGSRAEVGFSAGRGPRRSAPGVEDVREQGPPSSIHEGRGRPPPPDCPRRLPAPECSRRIALRRSPGTAVLPTRCVQVVPERSQCRASTVTLTARPRRGCRPPRSPARPRRGAARAGTS